MCSSRSHAHLGALDLNLARRDAVCALRCRVSEIKDSLFDALDYLILVHSVRVLDSISARDMPIGRLITHLNLCLVNPRYWSVVPDAASMLGVTARR